MSSDVVLPKQLKIVSWAFIFVGFLALIETLYSLMNTPTLNINFLIVFIFVGFKLLKRRQLWRSFAVACATVVLIFSVGKLFFIFSGRLSFEAVPMADLVIFWVVLTTSVLASGYALWALQSKEVRDVFEGRY